MIWRHLLGLSVCWTQKMRPQVAMPTRWCWRCCSSYPSLDNLMNLCLMIEDPISNVVLISCFKKFPTTCFLFFIQCKKDARVQKCEKQNRDKAYRILNYSTLKSGTAHRCFLLITHAAWCWILLITHDEYFIHILYFLCTDIRAYINFIWSSSWNRFLTT